MQVNDELLIDLGFVKTDDCWVDEHTRLYTHQLPATLKDLKKILTGTAYNKGVRRGKELSYSNNSTYEVEETSYVSRTSDY